MLQNIERWSLKSPVGTSSSVQRVCVALEKGGGRSNINWNSIGTFAKSKWVKKKSSWIPNSEESQDPPRPPHLECGCAWGGTGVGSRWGEEVLQRGGRPRAKGGWGHWDCNVEVSMGRPSAGQRPVISVLPPQSALLPRFENLAGSPCKEPAVGCGGRPRRMKTQGDVAKLVGMPVGAAPCWAVGAGSEVAS